MKILRLAVVMILATSISSLAQMTGGGASTSASPATKAKGSNPNKWSSLHFGLSQPMGKFRENNLTVPFTEAVGAKPGFYISYDFNSYLTPDAELVKIGLSGTVGMAFNGPNWESWVQGEDVDFTPSTFMTNDIKFGVMGTYEMNDDLKIDAFLRLGLNWGVGGGGEWMTASNTVIFTGESPGAGFGLNAGVNVRYRQLLTTLQLNPAKIKYRYQTYDEDGLEFKVPVSLLKLGVGVNFGNY